MGRESVEHSMLVLRGATYLKKLGCSIISTDARSARNAEHPDVVGWFKNGDSVVIEAKAKRKDFREDWRPDRKEFRREPGAGMGVRRYYLCRPNLIRTCDVESRGWGLLWACTSGVVEVRPSPIHIRNAEAELRLMSRLAVCVAGVADGDQLHIRW